MRLLMTIGLMIATASLLAGCGQKGVLYREQPAAAPTANEVSSPADPDLSRKSEQEALP